MHVLGEAVRIDGVSMCEGQRCAIRVCEPRLDAVELEIVAEKVYTGELFRRD